MSEPLDTLDDIANDIVGGTLDTVADFIEGSGEPFAGPRWMDSSMVTSSTLLRAGSTKFR